MSDLLYDRPRYRILEKIDSAGVSRFVPQRKFLFWWLTYESHPCGDLEFTNYEECKEWLLYERTVIVRCHVI